MAICRHELSGEYESPKCECALPAVVQMGQCFALLVSVYIVNKFFLQPIYSQCFLYFCASYW